MGFIVHAHRELEKPDVYTFHSIRKGVKSMTNQERENRDFGRALRELRHEAGATQDLVAHCAGYEQPHVSRVEYGLTPASVPMLAGYAKATQNPKGVLALVETAIQRNGRVS